MAKNRRLSRIPNTLTGDQTGNSLLHGVMSGSSAIFTGTVIGATPTLANHLTTKSYVDGLSTSYALSSHTHTTSQVTEGTNLYFTEARSRASLSFTAGSGAYNSSTGTITIPTNNNQIANGAGYLINITSAQVTGALGFTPYNSSNPSGFITSSALSGYALLSGASFTGTVTANVFQTNSQQSYFLNNAGNNDFILTGGGTFRILNQAQNTSLFSIGNTGDLTGRSSTFSGSVSLVNNNIFPTGAGIYQGSNVIQIVSGTAGFGINNNANTVVNFAITNAGAATFSGSVTSPNFYSAASEGREVQTYFPVLYTTNEIVSGTRYQWYADNWRLGNARGGSTESSGFRWDYNGSQRMFLNTSGNLSVTSATFGGLSGSGVRMVVADASGALSTQAIPSGGGGSFLPLSGGTLTGALTGTSATFSGIINSTSTEVIKVNQNNGYLSFWNNAGNARTGYLQFNHGGEVILDAETTTGISFNIANVTRYRITQAGNHNFGTGNAIFGGTVTTQGLNIGNNGSSQPFFAESFGPNNGISFGAVTTGNDYRIYTKKENINGDYSKLTLGWHTGIKMGAAPLYGGVRFYNNAPDEGGVLKIFSVGELDNNVRVYNSLVVVGSVTAPTFIGSLNGNASTATALPTCYFGGVLTNPQTYFNAGVGLKVAMTGFPSVWADTLWINGYSGGDVPNMNALHFLRNGQPRMFITTQHFSASSYGTAHEILSTFNYSSFAAGLTTTNTFTGINYFNTSTGAFLGSLSNSRLQAYSDSNNSAFMSFHKGGQYAVNLGLDADNVFRLGGWSAPANVMQIDMSGNLTMAGRGVFNGYIQSTNNYIYSPYGMYNPNHNLYFGQPFGSEGWFLRSNSTNIQIMLRTNNDVTQGYLYADNGGNSGLLNQYGSWAVQVYSGGGTLHGMWNVSGGFFDNSDARLKILTNKSIDASSIKGLSYIWNDGRDNLDHYGYLAQDVQKIMPWAVNEGKDGFLSVRYNHVFAVKIDNIEDEIKELKSKIVQLESRLN